MDLAHPDRNPINAPTNRENLPFPVWSNFEFTGTAAEYFKIWIVNIVLSIATLGIYSAWAKVRKERYFYGNTWVNGSSFQYTADPIKILKGRIIAFVFFCRIRRRNQSISGILDLRTGNPLPIVPFHAGYVHSI